jgi:20S proteasome subunit beta 7
LAHVDVYGTYLEKKYVATGMANYFCPVLIENNCKPGECDEVTARKLIEECFRCMYYRDCRASDRIQIAVINA